MVKRRFLICKQATSQIKGSLLIFSESFKVLKTRINSPLTVRVELSLNKLETSVSKERSHKLQTYYTSTAKF